MKYLLIFISTIIISCDEIRHPTDDPYINSFGFSNSTDYPLKIEVTNIGGQKRIINLNSNGKYNCWQNTFPDIPDSLTMKRISKVEIYFSEVKKLSFDCDKYFADCNGFSNPLEVKNYILLKSEKKGKLKLDYFYYMINKEHFNAAK